MREFGAQLLQQLLVVIWACSSFSSSLGEVAASSESMKVVGDEEGWSLPPGSSGKLNYTSWAQQRAFYMGDILVFQYDPKLHSVLQVGKEDYESCNVNGPLIQCSDGNTMFSLTTSGAWYFICGILNHCLMGQKLAITCFDPSPAKHSPSLNGSKSPNLPPMPSTSISPSPYLDQPSPSSLKAPYPTNFNSPYSLPFLGPPPPPTNPSETSSPSSLPSPIKAPPNASPNLSTPCECHLFSSPPPPPPLIALPSPPPSNFAPPPASPNFSPSQRPNSTSFGILLLLCLWLF